MGRVVPRTVCLASCVVNDLLTKSRSRSEAVGGSKARALGKASRPLYPLDPTPQQLRTHFNLLGRVNAPISSAAAAKVGHRAVKFCVTLTCCGDSTRR